MFPLYILPLIWFVLLAIFAIMALLSVIQLLRYGIAGPGTYLTTTLFLVVCIVTVVGASAYLVTINWQQSIDVLGSLRSLTIFNP